MSSTGTQTYDVAIIGAGPVGTTLANFLGLLGISTVILEREEKGYHLPRAVACDDEIMRIFQAAGLAQKVGAVMEPGLGALFVDALGRTLVHWRRPQERNENGYFANYRFHQPRLEQVLRDGLERFDCVDLIWGWDAKGFVQTPDHVEISGDQSGQPQLVRAKYLVGADGGRSFTREALGIQNEDLGFHEPWLIVDVILNEEDPDQDRNTNHFCGGKRMGSKIFVGLDRKRWEFRLNPGDDPETIGRPEKVWPMLEEWITPDEGQLERTTVYTFHSTIAEAWRAGRVFIAGDAAHQTPPFMGQGMCAGIRDANSLAWKLAAVLRGQAPDALLDTYETERKPHVRKYIELTIDLGHLINRTSDEISGDLVSKREAGGQQLAQLRPLIGPGLSAGETGLRGKVFPQFRATSAKNSDDQSGYHPTLYVSGEVPPEWAEQFAGTGVNLRQADREIKGWLELAGAAGVLVRPDRAVLGHVTELGRITELLPKNWRFAAEE